MHVASNPTSKVIRGLSVVDDLTLEQIVFNPEHLAFRLNRTANTGQVVHEQLRVHMQKRAREFGLNEDEAQRFWMATFEAIQNAMLHGCRKGGSIEVHLRPVDTKAVEVDIIQPEPWPNWKEYFAGQGGMSIADATEPNDGMLLGGTVIMLKFAECVTGSNQGRRLTMRFSHQAVAGQEA